jgi:hypothetical protein
MKKTNFDHLNRLLKPLRTIGLAVWVAAQSGNFSSAANATGPDPARWAASVFAGAPPASTAPATTLTVRQQDYGQLGINRSVIGTPLRIGQQDFSHGLGTHANSEIVISFSPGTAKRLKAMVGVQVRSNLWWKSPARMFFVRPRCAADRSRCG